QVERLHQRGQATLSEAVSAEGPRRSELLGESIRIAQQTSAAWTRYRSSALDLPGEQRLASRYEEDQAEVQAASSAVLIPLLTSPEPGVLPPEQVTAHQAVIDDLQALHTLYRDERRTDLASLQSDIDHSERAAILLSGAAMLTLLIAAAVAMRRARRVQQERQSRREAQRLVEFEGRLRRALELVDDEQSAYRVAERGMSEMAPNGTVSVVIADASRATLRSVE